MNLPAGTDQRWAEWARPLASSLLAGPRARSECLRLSTCRSVRDVAPNVLAWLELEGFVVAHAGHVTLTEAGQAWIGDRREPGPLLESSSSRGACAIDLLPCTCSYGRLHPLERAGRSAWGNALWFCACECGSSSVVSTRHLRSGLVRSCGCLRAELRASGLRPSAWRTA